MMLRMQDQLNPFTCLRNHILPLFRIILFQIFEISLVKLNFYDLLIHGYGELPRDQQFKRIDYLVGEWLTQFPHVES